MYDVTEFFLEFFVRFFVWVQNIKKKMLKSYISLNRRKSAIIYHRSHNLVAQLIKISCLYKNKPQILKISSTYNQFHFFPLILCWSLAWELFIISSKTIKLFKIATKENWNEDMAVFLRWIDEGFFCWMWIWDFEDFRQNPS